MDEAAASLVDLYEAYEVERSASSAADGPADSSGFPDPDYSFVGSTGASWGFKVGAFTALNIAEALDDSLDLGCQQTIPIPFTGGSIDCSLCCLATAALKAVAWSILESINFIDDDICSWETQAALDRTCHLHDDLLAAQGAMNEMGNRIDTLLVKLDDLAENTELLREATCEHMRLIQLPQNQRASDLRQCPEWLDVETQR